MGPRLSKGYPLHQIQAISAANDIVDVVGEHVALKSRGKNSIGLCPFHKEKTPSFTVSHDRQIYKCFGCGAGGDVIKFIQNILGLSFLESLEHLARRGGVPFEPASTSFASTTSAPKSDLYKVNSLALEIYRRCLWDHPAGERARNYLLNRKLMEATSKSFSLGYAPSGGKTLVQQAAKAGFSPDLLVGAGLASLRQGTHHDVFWDRLMFPIVDVSGHVIGFGGRTLTDAEPKYLNTSETAIFQKSRCLFGLHQARPAIQSSRQVAVVEGYTDCIACHQAGIEDVVATLGTALTEQHASMLRRYADRIVLVFDADQAGQKAADRALGVFLTLGVDVKIAQLPSGKDPCDLVVAEGPDALRGVLSGATEALEYKWNQLRDRYDVSGSSRQRRLAVDELLQTIAACDPWGKVDAIQRGMVLNQLAGLLSVSVEELGRELQKHRRQLARRRTASEDKSNCTIKLPAPQNAAQAAFKELLEVLICEPGYIGGLTNVLSPKDFEPDAYRSVAEHLWHAYSTLDEFDLRELLSMVEETNVSNIITELHREGSRRGNFAETVEEAVQCIQEHRREQEASRITASINQVTSEEELDRQLQMLQVNLNSSARRTAGPMID